MGLPIFFFVTPAKVVSHTRRHATMSDSDGDELAALRAARAAKTGELSLVRGWEGGRGGVPNVWAGRCLVIVRSHSQVHTLTLTLTHRPPSASARPRRPGRQRRPPRTTATTARPRPRCAPTCRCRLVSSVLVGKRENEGGQRTARATKNSRSTLFSLLLRWRPRRPLRPARRRARRPQARPVGGRRRRRRPAPPAFKR